MTAGSQGTIVNPNFSDLQDTNINCNLLLRNIPQYSVLELNIYNYNYCNRCFGDDDCEDISVHVSGTKHRICSGPSTPYYIYKNTPAADPVAFTLISSVFTANHIFNITYRGEHLFY